MSLELVLRENHMTTPFAGEVVKIPGVGLDVGLQLGLALATILADQATEILLGVLLLHVLAQDSEGNHFITELAADLGS